MQRHVDMQRTNINIPLSAVRRARLLPALYPISWVNLCDTTTASCGPYRLTINNNIAFRMDLIFDSLNLWIRSAVPQGCVFGTRLFVIYVFWNYKSTSVYICKSISLITISKSISLTKLEIIIRLQILTKLMNGSIPSSFKSYVKISPLFMISSINSRFESRLLLLSIGTILYPG